MAFHVGCAKEFGGLFHASVKTIRPDDPRIDEDLVCDEDGSPVTYSSADEALRVAQ